MNLVMLFSTKENTFTVLDHNLTHGEALKEMTRLRTDGLPAFILSYTDVHKGEAEKCKECEHQVEKITSR